MVASIKIKTYAKINLYLDVVGKYPDGFHEIESIFQTVSLADTLTFNEIPEGIHITTNNELLPTNEKNIVYKTVKKIQEITKVRRGIHINIEKYIPICAGLGGGSANSAGTVYALNKLWDLNLGQDTLLEIASELGSDVPYFLKGGTQAVGGRGERLSPIIPMSNIWIVLIHPPFSLSTARVYQHPALKIRPRHKRGNKYSFSFCKAICALYKSDWGKVIYNRLEIPAFNIHPELRELKLKVKKLGFPYVGMTGSGSTFFVIVESKEQGEQLMNRLNWKTNLVRTIPFAIQEV